jgi:hypothetical protein
MANLSTERRLTGGYNGHHHTLVDHRPGGRPVAFAADPSAWLAVDIEPVQRHHAYEAIGRLESHVASETHRLNLPAAAVLRSCDDRHVAAVLALPGGHRAFASLARTWEDPGSLSLCLVTAVAGLPELDPASHTAIAVERFELSATRTESVLPLTATARGFVGAAILGAEDGKRAFALYRFEYRSDLDDFRSDAAVVALLGPPALSRYHIVKTYSKTE